MKPLFGLLLVLSMAVLAGCGAPPPQLAPPEPPIVTVETPVLRDLDSLAEFTGRLASTESQEVRAQVTGYLIDIKFKDGDIITQKGQVLYEIDSQPYAAALANATAQVSKASSDVSTAEKQLALAKSEWDNIKNSTIGISKEERDRRKNAFDTAETSLNAAKSQVDSLKAMVTKAKFDVDNCKIRSEVQPPARVSRTEITKGNLVQAGQTVLCKVTSLNPMYVYFEVDEDTSLMYRRRIYVEKTLADPREKQLDCWIGLRDEARGPDGKWTHPGKVDYIAPEIIRGLGTREIRATIDNPAPYRLSPGDSVRIQVVSGAKQKLLTIPEIAVGSQQQQKFVYVINEKDGKHIAEFRPVVLGPTREIDGVRLQVISKGLSETDRVVVNGLLRVRPGAPVKPEVSSLVKK